MTSGNVTVVEAELTEVEDEVNDDEEEDDEVDADEHAVTTTPTRIMNQRMWNDAAP